MQKSIQLYENIKKRRKELNMSQQELAEAVGYSGKSMISQIENGLIDLSVDMIVKIAEALHVEPGDLMGSDGIVDYIDSTYIVEPKENELDERTLKFIKNYSAASPEVQKAIDLLLKVDQSGP